MSDAITRAFKRLDRAQSAVLDLAVSIGNGATAGDFNGEGVDARIRTALRAMHEARHDADVALCTFMRGEPYQPRPTQSAQGVEMQARVARNERQTRGTPTGVPAIVPLSSFA